MGIMAVSPRLSCGCCRKPHVQKVVVSMKFEQGPPADSWSWGKYGQKPIKGSPHPRSYYKCSSYRGCPARKQVEKCRSESTRLIVTYTTDQNHQSYATVQRKNKIITLTRVTQVLSSTMACHLLNQQLHLPSSVVKRSRDFFDELEELSSSQCLLPPAKAWLSWSKSSFFDARTSLMTHGCLSGNPLAKANVLVTHLFT